MEILPPDESDVTDDEMETSVGVRSTNGNDGDTESDDEGRPLLMNNGSSSNRDRETLNGKWYDVFTAKKQ